MVSRSSRSSSQRDLPSSGPSTWTPTGSPSGSCTRLEATSSGGAYADMAGRFRANVAAAYRRAVDPVVVARAVTRAIEARRPRTRYAMPVATSSAIIWLRRHLGDRAMDRLLATQLR